jgi:hypothetical protein
MREHDVVVRPRAGHYFRIGGISRAESGPMHGLNAALARKPIHRGERFISTSSFMLWPEGPRVRQLAMRRNEAPA